MEKMFGGLCVFIVCLLTLCSAENPESTNSSRRTGRDSYLDAYKESHGVAGGAQPNSNSREYVESQGYPYSQYGPPTGPSGPSGPPKIIYGPPSYPQPAPVPQYGPPAPVYGPPPYQPVFAGVPYAFLGILDKFKHKLDLFFIGKIILKLVLFKKLVSFIAIICLLLFLPTLKSKIEPSDSNNNSASSEDGDDVMMMRSLNSTETRNEKINNLATFVLDAIEHFGKKEKKNSNCSSLYCKTRTVLKKIDQKLSYKKLAKLYSKDLQQ